MERLMRSPEVQEVVGLSRATIYNLTKENRFPKPLQISNQSVGWTESSIQGWIQNLVDDQASQELAEQM